MKVCVSETVKGRLLKLVHYQFLHKNSCSDCEMDKYLCVVFALRWFAAWQLVNAAVKYIAN